MPWRADADSKAESGHVLLALLHLGDEQLLRELARRGIAPEAVAAAVLGHFRGRAREEAETAAKYIAEAVGAGKLEQDALYRSVLRDYWGVAAQVLRELGGRGAGEVGAGASAAVASRPLVQLDDGSDRTIYEQIVAQVQEGIATGRVRGGERLPTVRELADRLGIAPGTVARAYTELERQNLVVTQGTRGTRVAERGGGRDAALVNAEQLPSLLRPAVVAAYHMGATAAQLRTALEDAMKDIFPPA